MSADEAAAVDLSGEVELADGTEVTIHRPDEVYPIIAKVDASLDVVVEQDRIRMKEIGKETELTLATPHRRIDNARPVATIFSGISSAKEDDTYSEIAFDSFEEIRELRDALDLVLQYHGVETESDTP